MELNPQRVSKAMLGRISTEITRKMQALGIDKQSRKIEYNKNYFELGTDWLSACYSYKVETPSRPVPVHELRELDDIPKDRSGYAHSLQGFSSLVITEAGQPAEPAIFLNSDVGTPQEACHTLIHEAVHMNSHESRGFQASGFIGNWNSPPLEGGSNTPPRGLSEGFYELLDEGTTELIARVVTSALQKTSTESSAPAIPVYRDMPIYEYPLAAVCDIATEVGIQVLAKAFFRGDFALQNALRRASQAASVDACYSEIYFERLSRLSVIWDHYAPPQRSHYSEGKEGDRDFKLAKSQYSNKVRLIKQINELGVDLPDPQKLASSVANKAHNDPALVLWRRTIGPEYSPEGEAGSGARSHPAVLALASVAAAYTAYRVARKTIA